MYAFIHDGLGYSYSELEIRFGFKARESESSSAYNWRRWAMSIEERDASMPSIAHIQHTLELIINGHSCWGGIEICLTEDDYIKLNHLLTETDEHLPFHDESLPDEFQRTRNKISEKYIGLINRLNKLLLALDKSILDFQNRNTEILSTHLDALNEIRASVSQLPNGLNIGSRHNSRDGITDYRENLDKSVATLKSILKALEDPFRCHRYLSQAPDIKNPELKHYTENLLTAPLPKPDSTKTTNLQKRLNRIIKKQNQG